MVLFREPGSIVVFCTYVGRVAVKKSVGTVVDVNQLFEIEMLNDNFPKSILYIRKR